MRAEDHPTRTALLSAALLAAYFLVGLLTATNGQRWGDDWAQYTLHAMNIVRGEPYSHIGYLFNPDIPNVGPPSYPPGLPLLLAPILALFGVNLVALKATCFACIVLALPVAYRVLSQAFGKREALIAVVAFALHPYVWGLRDDITSEAPFLLFSLLALWCATRGEDSPSGTWASVGNAIAVGVLMCAAVACRSIGIALLPALLVYGWSRRRPLAWFGALLLSFFGLVALQSSWLVRPPTYGNELVIPSLGLITENAFGYWRSFSYLFPLPLQLGPVAAMLVVMAGVAGMGSLLARPDGSLAAHGARNLVARVPLAAWYLLSYLSALLLASIEPDLRYVLPVVPIAFAVAVRGAGFVAGRLRIPMPAFAVAAALVFASALFLYQHPTAERSLVTCSDCSQMLAFIRAETPPSSVVLFAKPRAMALLGERPSWAPSQRYSEEELLRKLRAMDTRIVVVATAGSEFARTFPAAPSLESVVREPGWRELFHNKTFVVYSRET